MKTLINKVQLIGNLGKDPEVKTVGDGRKMARTSIATTESYKNKEGEWVNQTTWHNLVAWGAAAERFSKRLGKGDNVAIEGRLVNRKYVDKDGVTRYSTDVEVSDLVLMNKQEPAMKQGA
jgi:single-strand DNA-binding protein